MACGESPRCAFPAAARSAFTFFELLFVLGILGLLLGLAMPNAAALRARFLFKNRLFSMVAFFERARIRALGRGTVEDVYVRTGSRQSLELVEWSPLRDGGTTGTVLRPVSFTARSVERLLPSRGEVVLSLVGAAKGAGEAVFRFDGSGGAGQGESADYVLRVAMPDGLSSRGPSYLVYRDGRGMIRVKEDK